MNSINTLFADKDQTYTDNKTPCLFKPSQTCHNGNIIPNEPHERFNSTLSESHDFVVLSVCKVNSMGPILEYAIPIRHNIIKCTARQVPSTCIKMFKKSQSAQCTEQTDLAESPS